MKAAVFHGRQDVRIEDVPAPTDPGPGEVVLEVTRAAICGTDSSEWAHGPVLCSPPVVLGHEFVGRVVARGDDVDGLAIGDRVVSGAGISCGRCARCVEGRTNLCSRYRTLGLQADGGLTAFVTTPARICRPVPESCDDDAAAIAQPFAVALHALRRAEVAAGQRVALVGVGGIGAFLVSGAARRGAMVSAFDIDPGRLSTARALGAVDTVDVSGRDLAETLLEHSDGEGFDVVIEASGAPHAPSAAATGARRGGCMLLVGLQAAPRELDLTRLAIREVDIVSTVAHVCDVDLPEALGLLATGELARTIVDRTIPLDALVEEGLRPLASRTAKGKILVDPR